MSFESTILGAGLPIELSILLILIIRKMWYGRFIFTTYIAWSIISDTLFFYLEVSHRSLTLTPYIAEISIDSILQFMVICEIAWQVVKPVKTALPTKALAILPLLLVGIGIFCWPFASMVVPDNLLPNGHAMLVLNQTVAILRIAFFVLLAAFSQFFSIGWRDREMQIASGFGFYAAISLIVAIIHSHGMVGPQYHWLDLVTSFGYLGTLAYWVVAFAQKEPETRKISPQMIRFLISIGGTIQADKLALETVVKKKSGSHSH